MKKITKLLIMLILPVVFATGISVRGFGYTYSHRGEAIHSTPGYEFAQNLTFDNLGINANEFESPEDLYVYNEELIYIVDSKSNTLFVFTTGFELITKVHKFVINRYEYQYDNLDKIVTTSVKADASRVNGIAYEDKRVALQFDENGNATMYPYNIAGVHRFNNNIYIADKGNQQIIIVDSETFKVKQVITTPEDNMFKWHDGTPARGEANDNQVLFQPTKLVTDLEGRIYAISDGVYRGILEFGLNGHFNRFVGVNKITLSPWELFWRAISTDIQLSRRETVVNTIFTSLSMDSKGFIYATSRATEKDGVVTNDNEMIKLINTRSDDVLKRNGYNPPKGDIVYSLTHRDTSKRGPSRFSAITSTPYGTYTVADSKMGRLFTYDDEGYLLYVSGEYSTDGQQLDKINMPVAIKYLGEDLVVLDRANRSILIFKPTPIAKLINQATYYYYHGDFKESSRLWGEVVRQNQLYEYAYVGIGKNLYNQGRYKEAMEHFEMGFARENYSRAYKQYRDQKIRVYFGPVMTIIIGGYIVSKAYKFYDYRKRKKYMMEEGEE